MTMSFGIVIIIVILMFLLGMIGIFVPIIPGTPLIWCGIMIFALGTNFHDVTWITIVVTGVLAIAGVIIDALAGVIGAKIYGASWYGVIGALCGGTIGLVILQMIGLVVGTLLGTFIGEYVRHQNTHNAMTASAGTIIGFVANIFIQIIISCAMIGIFIFSILLF